MIPINMIAFPLALILAIILVGILFFKLIKSREESKNYKEKHEKELSFRKSSEVRLGKIGENLAPFLKDWPWDPRRFRFLGHPVDGIQFNGDEIIFVEVKTGGARLSRSQKGARDLIKKGKVSFVTFKITSDGTKLVKTE